MARARIVISEFMDEPAVDSLRGSFEVSYDPKLVDDAARLQAAAAACDALIVRNRTQVRGALLAAASCKVIGRLGVGLDNIDVAACAARGITVIPATGANALSVAEYVVGQAMSLLRGASYVSAQMTAGQWPRPRLSEGREIAGKVLGLVGFGSIGQVTGRLARALGMRLIAHDPMLAADDPVWRELAVTRCDLDGLLGQADVVSLHLPLTPDTRGLMSATRLALMKRESVLINTARGGIVDEAALVAALRAGALGGAAIDVFDNEPLAAGSVWVDCPNLVLTPHIAGVTAEANTRVSALIAERVAQALTV